MKDWREMYEAVQDLPEEEREHFFNLLVLREVREILYYVILAVVVIVLGSRLINGLLAAIRETRGDAMREDLLDELEEVEELEGRRR